MDDDDMLTDPHTFDIDAGVPRSTSVDDTAAAISLEDDHHHPRTIVYIDIDCFYAQVEELQDPTLRTRPLGIQQKNIVVTCNYVARERGVGKLQLIAEALRRCPDLVLVRGEDLTKYRRMSASIFELLQRCNAGGAVERLGMDENYVDVSALVAQRMDDFSRDGTVLQGFVYPETERFDEMSNNGDATATVADDFGVDDNDDADDVVAECRWMQKSMSCRCGCVRRLTIGTQLAAEMRARLHAELGITSCAGIAHNKLLAKWVGSRHKPNQQTVFVPWLAAHVWRTAVPSLRQICGIGERTEVLLREMHVETVTQLQDCAVERLRRQFGVELAGKLKSWAFGRDAAPVKASGAVKSIGLEDSCRSMTVRVDVETKFRLLLIRLVEQVIEDGRVPIVIKSTVRKFDAQRRSSHRETKQANVPSALFRQLGDGKILLAEGAQDKLLKIVMRLFERTVDLQRPFNITLLGLAFSKFQERGVFGSSRRGAAGFALGGASRAGGVAGLQNIASFLIKRSADVEVQSVTSLSSDGFASANVSDVTEASATSTTVDRNDTTEIPRYVNSSPVHMDFDCISDTSHASCSSDVSESEVEPSPKKSRIGIGLLMSKRRCLQATSDRGGGAGGSKGTVDRFDASSPSKLRVGELRLSAPTDLDASAATSASTSKTPTVLQPSTPKTPRSLRSSLPLSPLISSTNASPVAPFHSLFYPSPLAASSQNASPSLSTVTSVATSPSPLSSSRLSAISAIGSGGVADTTDRRMQLLLPDACPPSVDRAVFRELPTDVQAELLAQWRRNICHQSTAAFVSTATTLPLSATTTMSAAVAGVGSTSITMPDVHTVINNATSVGGNSSGVKKKSKANTLHRYFIANS